MAEQAAKAELDAAEADLEGWQDVLRTAIRLAGNCHAAYMTARPSIRRRFNDARLHQRPKDRPGGVLGGLRASLPSPSSDKALMVEVGGVEPPSPGDRSGLLRAQPVVGSHLEAPTGGDPRGQPGFGVRRRPPGGAASVSLLTTPDPRSQASRGGRPPRS